MLSYLSHLSSFLLTVDLTCILLVIQVVIKMKDKWPRATPSAPRNTAFRSDTGCNMEGNHSQSRAAYSPLSCFQAQFSLWNHTFPSCKPSSAQQPLDHPVSKCKGATLIICDFLLEWDFRSHGADAKFKPAPSEGSFNQQFLLLLVLMGDYIGICRQSAQIPSSRFLHLWLSLHSCSTAYFPVTD